MNKLGFMYLYVIPILIMIVLIYEPRLTPIVIGMVVHLAMGVVDCVENDEEVAG